MTSSRFTFLKATSLTIFTVAASSQLSSAVSHSFEGVVTSTSALGISQGVNVGSLITGFFSLSARPADLEVTETHGSVTAGIWAGGQFGPGSGFFDLTITISSEAKTWTVSSLFDEGGFLDGIINVNNGDGNQNVGSYPAVIGDELHITTGTRSASNFPGFTSDNVAYSRLIFQDLNAPFDFITDSSVIPSVIPFGVVGSGELFFEDNNNFTTTPLFTFDVIPEPSTSLLSSLACLALLMRRRRFSHIS
ncbi:PEP-CTERM sorting domain-containing protein [Roseibacillus persicicus]|uniref:PEP-CTERM sorting domain-containing protein n=1 Tax=Roseibacillus persicicus TaxID=454148 RepID=UPI00280D4F7E|nr:PEP-CTERM sorting domain-containing protein [Roseibacillus persicicus]MDQ8192546.1 PEP-CTERM sorting domain-containing protein [Roseibacillus persicicus]